MYYVTMTDRFLSGWGQAKGRINKLVIACETYGQAEVVERNARKRDEMKYINITPSKPRYSSRQYLVSWETYDDLGEIWKA